MGTLENTLFQQLAQVCAESKQAYAQYIGMSQARLQLLTLLGQGEITHAALQQHLLLDGATITRLVKQFEAEGLLGRRLDPQDNRYTLVALTPSGQQVVAGLQETHSAFQSQMLDGISGAEREIVVRVLERLRANMRTIQVQGETQE